MTKRSNPLHWMPLSVDFWLGELTGGLRADQKGALADLLFTAWQMQPPCTLPNDDAFLAGRSGLGAKWKANRAAILARFTPTDDGRLLCGWLRDVYDEQHTKYINRSNANRTNRNGTKEATNRGTIGSTNDRTIDTTIRGTHRLQSIEGPLPLQGKKDPATDDALALEAPRSVVATDEEHRERERLARIGRRVDSAPGSTAAGFALVRDAMSKVPA